MAEGFRCVVATPTRELFARTVYYADVPGSDGHYGVLSGHESLVALNHRGGKLTLHLDPDGNEKKVFLIHCGCTQMLHNHLSVLGRFGCDPETIDVAEIKSKADELRKVVEARKAEYAANPPEGKHAAADRAGIDNQETHLSWYEAQIEYAETGKEYSKQ